MKKVNWEEIFQKVNIILAKYQRSRHRHLSLSFKWVDLEQFGDRRRIRRIGFWVPLNNKIGCFKQLKKIKGINKKGNCICFNGLILCGAPKEYCDFWDKIAQK
jgi:hypothetical protein